MTSKVTFRIANPILESGEENAVMCVSGSCKELGSWEPKGLVRMVQNQKQDLNRRVWQVTVNLPGDTEIEYRYALCSFHQAINGKVEEKVIIHRWETNIQPRKLVTKGADHVDEDQDQEEAFGHYGDQHNIDRGWLTNQSEIVLLIHGRPLTLQGHTDDEVPPYSIKVIARQERAMTHEQEMSSKKRKKIYDILPVFIRVLNDDELEPRLHQDGRLFNKDDIALFSVQTLKPESMSFKVEICSQEVDCPSESLGVAIILGRNVQYCSPRHIPVIDEELDSIGTLQVTCFMVKPLPENVCNFANSFSKYWNWSRRCVEIGHRGMGRSLQDKSLLIQMPTSTSIPENTVRSLQQAIKHGADFVEFDIHVTKDRVPVIGHDFQAALTTEAFPGHRTPLYLEVPINFLNISEIDSLKTGQCLALEHTANLSPCSSPTRTPVPKEMQLFPTLQFALEEVDLDLGFLIEVKYPMEVVEGGKEMEREKHPLERNLLTDAILNIVLPNGGNRRIILCAFDPYVCAMLRLKQNKYPVMYNNFGPSERYDLYEGPLCRGIPVARLFAKSMGFIGLSSHSIDLLRNPDLLASCIETNLITFCWGEDNNEEDIVQKLKDMRVNGVLHDSMGKYPPNRNNIFKEEKLQKIPVLQTNGDDLAMSNSKAEDPSKTLSNGEDPSKS